MADTLLSPTIITRKALSVLHQEATFLKTLNRQYDDRFANGGASPSGKIGPSLLIRMPNRYTVTSGATMNIQDVEEESQTLTVSTRKHVAFDFTSEDLTMKIDDFTERYIRPAVQSLVSVVEADVFTNLYKSVYNLVDGDAAAFDFVHMTTAKEKLDDNLTPKSNRFALLRNNHTNKFLVATKGLFNKQGDIGRQYTDGALGNIAGLDVMDSTHVGKHNTGTAAKTTGYLTDIAAGEADGDTGVLHIDTGTTTFAVGDVITIADSYRVHPETKVSTGVLQQCVVTAAFAGNEGDLSISPSLFTSGPKQNINAIADGKAIVKVGAGASEQLDNSLAYHKDFATFVTADLEDVSKYGAWGARAQSDGISLRIARQWEPVNDVIPCRIDILYGYKALRPEWACRMHADG